MRRLAIGIGLVAIVVSGCDATQEPGPTSVETTTTSAVGTTSSTAAATTTTSPSTTTTTLLPLQSLAYEEVASFDFPVQVVPGADPDLVYVVDKPGYLWAMTSGEVAADPVLDLSSLVSGGGEQGFLAATLHPDDASRLFVHYTDTAGDTVIAEYAMADSHQADPDSATVLLEVDQPAGNHNGGMIHFDAEGSLLVGLGDGGGANDRYGNGQNTGTLLGGIVALDVDTAEAVLYNYGLRNPWRFWVDEDRIFIADVGQNAYEEVNVAPLQADLNFGWPILEGLHCFGSSDCDTAGITMPVVEVAHGDAGTCSITGGVVYRGAAIPEINGHYLFSDYCGGYLRSFDTTSAEIEVVDWTDQVGVPGNITGFGVDVAGEVYISTSGAVLKLVSVR